ncbi:uncharacterized protein LOC143186895 [Calliopsis andreniformis]|uniref:uncharacterized protein LOC143186895 n=1 Tax=Calliopsis andreniformis TaxID=337506 RepID=UPI003FCD9F9C
MNVLSTKVLSCKLQVTSPGVRNQESILCCGDAKAVHPRDDLRTETSLPDRSLAKSGSPVRKSFATAKKNSRRGSARKRRGLAKPGGTGTLVRAIQVMLCRTFRKSAATIHRTAEGIPRCVR